MDLLDKAIARRNALVAELAKLDNFIRTAKELMEDTSALSLMGAAVVRDASSTFGNGGDAAHIPNKTIVLNACRRFLAEHKALSLKDLLAKLGAEGINPGTSKPSVALSVMLSRSEDFKADRKKGGWTLAKGNAPSGANH